MNTNNLFDHFSFRYQHNHQYNSKINNRIIHKIIIIKHSYYQGWFWMFFFSLWKIHHIILYYWPGNVKENCVGSSILQYWINILYFSFFLYMFFFVLDVDIWQILGFHFPFHIIQWSNSHDKSKEKKFVTYLGRYLRAKDTKKKFFFLYSFFIFLWISKWSKKLE